MNMVLKKVEIFNLTIYQIFDIFHLTIVSINK